jgi:hypothetical protein
VFAGASDDSDRRHTWQQLLGPLPLPWAHPHIHFGYVDRTAGEQNVAIGQFFQQFVTAVPVIEDINQDAGVQQVGSAAIYLRSRLSSSS